MQPYDRWPAGGRGSQVNVVRDQARGRRIKEIIRSNSNGRTARLLRAREGRPLQQLMRPRKE